MFRGAMSVACAACMLAAVPGVAARVVHFNGFEENGCTSDDSDQDRLTGCAETALKLDPASRDTDGDGLFDGDEVLGTVSGLDLPAMGVDPRRKTILLEYDWFVDAQEPGGPNNCAVGPTHSHQPSSTALDIVTATFAASPVANPDGSNGIDVVHDAGQGGVFSGGSQIPDADGIVQGTATGGEYFQHYQANFALNRRGYFHYVLMPHRYFFNGSDASSGSAQITDGYRRDRIMVSLYCQATDEGVGNTVVHELGHNLGLHHGGDTDCNLKPNYNSVMNYRYQFKGVDVDCNAKGDGVADYSTGSRMTLDENALDESKGVCGDAPIDFTVSNGIQLNVAANINKYLKEIGECGSELTLLQDHDDWGALEIGVDATVSPDGGKEIDEAVDCGPAE